MVIQLFRQNLENKRIDECVALDCCCCCRFSCSASSNSEQNSLYLLPSLFLFHTRRTCMPHARLQENINYSSIAREILSCSLSLTPSWPSSAVCSCYQYECVRVSRLRMSKRKRIAAQESLVAVRSVRAGVCARVFMSSRAQEERRLPRKQGAGGYSRVHLTLTSSLPTYRTFCFS